MEERILELLRERDGEYFDENDDEINVLSNMKESLKFKDELIDELIDKNNNLNKKNLNLNQVNDKLNEKIMYLIHE